MADNFLGEIRPVGFNFAPSGWALCNGSLLSIAQNTALFSLLGTQYGGDGRSTFALPNLQGQMAVGQGQGAGLSFYSQGQTGGTENVTLLNSQIPGHTHTLPVGTASGRINAPSPSSFPGEVGGGIGGKKTNLYNPTADSNMAALSVGLAGGSQGHNNMMPYLVVNYVIALLGIFPSRA